MNSQPLVEVYSKDDCHLCDVAKEVLRNLQRRHPFRLVEIMIHPGMDEYEHFKERIPVIFVNKKFAFQHRVSEAELLNLLNEETNQREERTS